MKINELISDFNVFTTSEEDEVLSKCKQLRSFHSFTPREQFILETLIRKALVSKIVKEKTVMVLANEYQ